MFPTLLAAFLIAQAPVPDASAELKTILLGARVAHHFPGAVAMVSRQGVAVASAAVGVRKAGGSDPVTLDDRFHIGSVTKPMTATMIATLVEEGRLGWDDTLEKLFPEWKDEIHPALRKVTLTQLLSHFSGLQGFAEDEEFAALAKYTGDARSQRAQFARWLLARKPEKEPGTEQLYSNAGISVAAAAAERATGKPWGELMRERVFTPLGMKSARKGWPAHDDPKQPWGHWLRDGKFVPHEPNDSYQLNAVIEPAGDLQMTAADLMRFLDDHARGLAGTRGILKPETYRHLHTPVSQTAPAGIGWGVGSVGGRTRSMHTGSADTFYAIVMIDHEEGLEVVLLFDSFDEKPSNEVFRAIYNRFKVAAPPRGAGSPRGAPVPIG